MRAKILRPVVWTGVAGALLLGGCASTVHPPDDPSTLAAASAVDCKTFAAKASQKASQNASIQAAVSTLPSSLDPLEIANRAGHPDADAGGGDSEGDTVITPPLATLPLFSTAADAKRMPSGWQPWTVNRNKTPTRYALTQVDERVVLHAEADSSASGLYVPLEQRTAGGIRWTWKTRDVIRGADNGEKQREDAPLRLFVAFDGDHSTLSLRDQLMFEMARITTGREMPYATLMYIWGGRRAEGTVLSNPHTDRVRMIVVDSGSRHANEWRCHERDLRADYKKAFGTDPGKVIAVGLMTDTDNTKSRVEAWYGDIALD
ncbi:DUF3047 domain-containing protein [Cupriavidus pampae]|uniref:DUF3047 domain-containing protein n=1 Tax=Cupriavidus pampae TaxID=659251 RepID=A0ABM8XDN7_9BURK|nr:DUF3047 domain-containing protein [Cupriavidus pampae]CAG9178224.1 hypothetical protein LMG32289_03987 [Cupriavidus pampae]